MQVAAVAEGIAAEISALLLAVLAVGFWAAWSSGRRGASAASGAPVSRRVRAILPTVAAGITLLAVPTAYTIYPELTSRPIYQRWIVGGCWLALAVGAVFAGSKAQVELKALAQKAARDRTEQFRRAQSSILDAVLSGPGAREGFTWSVYLPDLEGWLLPTFPELVRTHEDPRSFSPGSGAVGTALGEGNNSAVYGNDVSNGSRRLRDSQRIYYQDYRAVIAIPLRTPENRVFGVLAGISKNEDQFYTTDEGVSEADRLSETVSVVVLELGA